MRASWPCVSRGVSSLGVLVIFACAIVVGAFLLLKLDPAGAGARTRDAHRASHVITLASAFERHAARYGGMPGPLELPLGAVRMIGEAASGCDTACPAAAGASSACLPLGKLLEESGLPAAPIDPRGHGFDAQRTGYYLERTETGLTVGACRPERGAAIVAHARIDSASGTGTMPASP